MVQESWGLNSLRASRRGTIAGMDEPDKESWPDKGLWIYAEFFASFLLFILIDSGIGGLILLMR